jgi:hypothetical protein
MLGSFELDCSQSNGKVLTHKRTKTGPYFPPLEPQARWITYVWSGIVPFPPRDQMNAGIAAYRSKRGQSQLQAMHLMALLFGARSKRRTRLEGVAAVGSGAIIWSAFSYFVPIEWP